MTDFIKRQTFGVASGLVEDLFPVIFSPMMIYGIGVNGTLSCNPVEIYPQIRFVAIDDFVNPAHVPMRFSTLWCYFLHRRRILRSGVDVLYVHSPEIALPFLFLNRRVPVIFHQHGSGNPLWRAKFAWA